MIYTGKVYKGEVKISELNINLDDHISVIETITDYLREKHGEDFSEECTYYEVKGDHIYYESETYIADGVDEK